MNNPFWHGGAKFYFSTTPGEGAQSEEFIWDESWKFDGSQDSDVINPLFRQVLTARASILADGGQIIKSRYSRSNQWHKDYDPQFYAKQGSPSMFYYYSTSAVVPAKVQRN